MSNYSENTTKTKLYKEIDSLELEFVYNKSIFSTEITRNEINFIRAKCTFYYEKKVSYFCQK